MKKLITYSVLIVLLQWSCGISIRNIELVDEWGNTYAEKAVDLQQKEIIFEDNTTDIWGIEKTNCKEFNKENSIFKSGNASLHLNWNKTENCPWIGMGIGWNSYVAKDITDWMQNGSLSFDLRSFQGNAFIPTLIFLLEDYNGKQSAAVLKASHLSKYPINEDWQNVKIPLSLFTENNASKCDFSFIKSLNIECQGQGNFYIDNIALVREPIKRADNKNYGTRISSTFPIDVLNINSWNYWGLGKFENRNVCLDSTHLFNGKPSIRIEQNTSTTNSFINEIGMSWTDWESTSFKAQLDSLSLLVYVQGNADMIDIGFESFKGNKKLIPLENKYYLKDSLHWKLYQIPFNSFEFEQANFQTCCFKQLICAFNRKGISTIGNIQIIKQN